MWSAGLDQPEGQHRRSAGEADKAELEHDPGERGAESDRHRAEHAQRDANFGEPAIRQKALKKIGVPIPS